MEVKRPGENRVSTILAEDLCVAYAQFEAFFRTYLYDLSIFVSAFIWTVTDNECFEISFCFKLETM